MEAFSLLKYWRGGGGGGELGIGGSDGAGNSRAIVTTVAHSASESDDEDDDDDGPFFDLEFAVNEENDGHEGGEKGCDEDNASDFGVVAEEDEDGEVVESDGEFNFTLSSASSSSNDGSEANPSLSPSDDLFFKGRLVHIVEPAISGDPNSKPQFSVSLMKSATKFRVFMLGLKKSKAEQKEKLEKSQPNERPEEKQATSSKKLFAVKFKVEEVPIMSLFTRDNSSRIFSKSQKHISPEEPQAVSDDKLFSKEAVQRYLKKVKPLYVRVSRRYSEKLRFSGQLAATAATKALQEKAQPEATEGAEPPPTVGASVRVQKPGNLPTGLREVCKHLGKSRSASSAVVAAAPSGSRRDDSLLEQQDGIQGAILHCKRSFNASRDSETSMFLRSVSDPLREKSSNPSRKSKSASSSSSGEDDKRECSV